MNKVIDVTQLQELINNHQNNPNLPIMTDVFVIDFFELDKFLTKARNTPRCDGIMIYFIRHTLTGNQDHIKKAFVQNEPDKNLSQLTLAFVPADITDPIKWKADHIAEDQKISTLLVCEPAASGVRDTKDKTGMCPPIGNCPKGKGG